MEAYRAFVSSSVNQSNLCTRMINPRPVGQFVNPMPSIVAWHPEKWDLLAKRTADVVFTVEPAVTPTDAPYQCLLDRYLTTSGMTEILRFPSSISHLPI